VPLWLLTIGFAAFSVLMVATGSSTGGGIAHLAHLTGLVIGLAYGEKLRREGAQAPQQLQFGGGRGPGGPGGPGGRRRP
jgi:membrane associated rhomboid family serine protease